MTFMSRRASRILLVASVLLALQTACKPTPAAPPPADQLVVLHAAWGALYEGLLTDVTSVVGSMVRGDALSVVADGPAFGDPAPGKIKYLRVVYARGTTIGKKIVGEGQTLAVAKGEKISPIRLMVAKAEYGNFAGGKIKDISLKVADMVQHDALTLGNYNAIFGDPAPKMSKELRVEYVVGVQIKQKTVPETETLVLSVREP
jgi:hypothetical protein